MRNRRGQQMRCGVLAVLCAVSLAAASLPERTDAAAGGLILPLAQAAPAPKPGAPITPSNTTAPGRMYIVEGIVVVLLFAGAVFAVCRASQRT